MKPLAKYPAQLANPYLAYAGSGTMNQTGDYSRLDGPYFGSNAQASRAYPRTVYPHSVWRDRVSDYGGN